MLLGASPQVSEWAAESAPSIEPFKLSCLRMRSSVSNLLFQLDRHFKYYCHLSVIADQPELAMSVQQSVTCTTCWDDIPSGAQSCPKCGKKDVKRTDSESSKPPSQVVDTQVSRMSDNMETDFDASRFSADVEPVSDSTHPSETNITTEDNLDASGSDFHGESWPFDIMAPRDIARDHGRVSREPNSSRSQIGKLGNSGKSRHKDWQGTCTSCRSRKVRCDKSDRGSDPCSGCSRNSKRLPCEAAPRLERTPRSGKKAGEGEAQSSAATQSE